MFRGSWAARVLRRSGDRGTVSGGCRRSAVVSPIYPTPPSLPSVCVRVSRGPAAVFVSGRHCDAGDQWKNEMGVLLHCHARAASPTSAHTLQPLPLPLLWPAMWCAHHGSPKGMPAAATCCRPAALQCCHQQGGSQGEPWLHAALTAGCPPSTAVPADPTPLTAAARP